MKTFIKIQSSIIRVSTINRVWYEHKYKSYLRDDLCSYIDNPDEDSIIIECADGSKFDFLYTNYKEYIKERSKIEAILLEEEPIHEPKKPHDYDRILNFCRNIWNYYGKTKDSQLTAQQIRKAICKLEGLDFAGYSVPDIYNKVAVDYGILSKVTTMSFKLCVD